MVEASAQVAGPCAADMDAANQYITATVLSLEKYMKERAGWEGGGDAADYTGCLINGGYQAVERETERGEMS